MNSLQELGYRRLLKDSLFDHPFGNRERSVTICAMLAIVAAFVFSLFISFFNCIRRRSNAPPSYKSHASMRGGEIATMPVFVYGDSSSYTPSFELKHCAICLAEFENDEEVRVLSNCKHLFHKDCIDQWVPLRSLLCPVCRDCTMEGERKPTKKPNCMNDWASNSAMILALGLGSNIPAPARL